MKIHSNTKGKKTFQMSSKGSEGYLAEQAERGRGGYKTSSKNIGSCHSFKLVNIYFMKNYDRFNTSLNQFNFFPFALDTS